MNVFSALLAGASLFFFAPAVVQCQPTAARQLTLDEVVQLGLANSKQLQASAARAAAAHARTQQTRDATFPTVAYNGSYYRLSDNIDPFAIQFPDGSTRVLSPVILDQFVNRFSVTEPVFTGLRALNTIRATAFLETAARFDADRDRKDVQLNLLNAALNLYKLEEARRVFDRSLLTAQTRLTDTRNLREQGLALDNDVLKADFALTQIQTARKEADDAIAAAQYSLALLLGLPDGTATTIDSTSVLASLPAAEGLDFYLGNAPNRADVQAAAQRALAAQKQLQITKGSQWPLLSVGANLYANNPNQRQFPIEDRFITTWDAGVTVSWTLSSFYTARHTIEEGKLNFLQNDLLRSQLTDAARTDIANNFYAWQTATGRIALSEKSVAQSLENQRVYQLRSGEQVSSTTDLLDADAQLLQARINLLSARADARLAYYRLLKSAGKL